MSVITKINEIFVPNYCNAINIIWIDRGILISIIYYIIRYYNILIKKIIIIDNKRYRNILKILFVDLKFKCYKKHNTNNYYFNIRKIIKNQDIIIDYLHNYDGNIPSKKFKFIPWYDFNDPIIIYLYSNKYFSKKNSFFIPLCLRGNYKGYIWDAYIEYIIFTKYNKFVPKMNIKSIILLINKFLINNYTDTVVYKYIYHNPIKINNNNNALLDLITLQVLNINKDLENKIVKNNFCD